MDINHQISTVTIPCTVLNLNSVDFLADANNEKVIGKLLPIPCRDVNYDNEESWAVPVKDNGEFTQFDYVLKFGEDFAQPTFDSLPCFRLRDKLGINNWMIYGTYDQFLNSCSTCCGAAAVPMPTIKERVAPCQPLDIFNDDGIPYALFGVPTLGAGESYYAYGSYNNVEFPGLWFLGYLTPELLVAAMNTNWTPFVWTLSDDELAVTGTGGTAPLNLCVSIITILGSA